MGTQSNHGMYKILKGLQKRFLTNTPLKMRLHSAKLRRENATTATVAALALAPWAAWQQIAAILVLSQA
jgi:hypothetical protein